MNIAIASLLVVTVANVAATTFVARADCYTRNQKLAQSCVVWFVPLLGAVLIVAFLFANRERIEHRSHHVPESNDYVPASHSIFHDP
jgi:hypothetical protein